MPPTVAAVGATVVKVMACGMAATVTVWVNSVAAAKFEVPDWSASIRQLPTVLKETMPTLIEHTDAELRSMLKVTGLPEPPPVAAGR